MLRKYDTIIIDEAHERSLNIDFLIGYLRELLPKRPDLKVIVTTATIDPESFARHFASADGTPAPVVEVSGRTYPVEIRYRPLVGEIEEDEDGETVESQRPGLPAGHQRRSRRARPRVRRRRARLPLRRDRDPGCRGCRSRPRTCRSPRSSRSTAGCRAPNSTGSSSRRRSPACGAASCSRRTSPRRA